VSTTHVLTYQLDATEDGNPFISYFKEGDAFGSESGSQTGGLVSANVPWRRAVVVNGPLPYGYAVLSAMASGTGGTLTCTVSIDGVVVVTQTVEVNSSYPNLACTLPPSP